MSDVTQINASEILVLFYIYIKIRYYSTIHVPFFWHAQCSLTSI